MLGAGCTNIGASTRRWSHHSEPEPVILRQHSLRDSEFSVSWSLNTFSATQSTLSPLSSESVEREVIREYIHRKYFVEKHNPHLLICALCEKLNVTVVNKQETVKTSND